MPVKHVNAPFSQDEFERLERAKEATDADNWSEALLAMADAVLDGDAPAREAAPQPDPPPEEAATDGGHAVAEDGAPSETVSESQSWDAGLSQPQRDVVEELVAVLEEQGGAVSAATLEYQIPVAYMGDVALEDVADHLGEHPDVEELSEGTWRWSG